MIAKGDIVRVRVWVEDDSGDELRSLYGWLVAEPQIRQYGAPAIEDNSTVEGALGTLDVVALAVGSGLTVAQLMTAIAGWQVTRPKKYLVRVTANGRSVEVR